MGLTFLLNSAALTKTGVESSDNNFFAPFEHTNQKLWEEGLKANLTSTQLACKIINKMAKKRKGVL